MAMLMAVTGCTVVPPQHGILVGTDTYSVWLRDLSVGEEVLCFRQHGSNMLATEALLHQYPALKDVSVFPLVVPVPVVASALWYFVPAEQRNTIMVVGRGEQALREYWVAPEGHWVKSMVLSPSGDQLAVMTCSTTDAAKLFVLSNDQQIECTWLHVDALLPPSWAGSKPVVLAADETIVSVDTSQHTTKLLYEKPAVYAASPAGGTILLGRDNRNMLVVSLAGQANRREIPFSYPGPTAAHACLVDDHLAVVTFGLFTPTSSGPVWLDVNSGARKKISARWGQYQYYPDPARQ